MSRSTYRHRAPMAVCCIQARGPPADRITLTPPHPMRATLLYIAAIAITMNVAGNLAANTAEGLKASQAARTERLCAVNPVYCD